MGNTKCRSCSKNLVIGNRCSCEGSSTVVELWSKPRKPSRKRKNE